MNDLCGNYTAKGVFEKYQNELYGEYVVDERERYLYNLAQEYYEATEAFDRIHCSGPLGPGGGILPISSTEMILINKNAREMLKMLQLKAEKEMGLNKFEVLRAIQSCRNEKRGRNE